MKTALVFMGLALGCATVEAAETELVGETVEIAPGVYQTTRYWGPMELPAASGGEPGSLAQLAGLSGFTKWIVGMFIDVADYDVPKPCEDCFITEFAPNLVFADGSTANFDKQVMMHHVNNLNIDDDDIPCDPGWDGAAPLLGMVAGGNQVFYGAGNERIQGKMPAGYGYHVDGDDEWVLNYHLMNMSPEPRTVYFAYTFTWVRSGVQKVLPIQIGKGMCSDYTYHTPEGYSDAHEDWQLDRSGYIVAASGHAHDYSIGVSVRNRTRDELVYTSVSLYEPGADFAPVGFSPIVDEAHPAYCGFTEEDPHGIGSYQGHIAELTAGYPHKRVEKGDVFRLHAQYYRPDAADSDMGIMLMFIDQDFCVTSTWCV